MNTIATNRVAPSFYLILAISVSVFLSTLDTSIMNTALSHIGAALLLSEASSVWLVTSYQMALLALILPVSSFADRIGYKLIFMCGLLIFTLGSLCCVWAESFPLLISARVLQGVGASAILGSNTALLRLVYPSDKLGKGLGLNALILALGVSLGPPLASFILSFASWHWLFTINIPIGFSMLFLVYKYMPKTEKVAAVKLDIVANVLCMLMFALFIFLIGEISNQKSWYFIGIEAVLMLICGIALYYRQRGEANPLLPVDLFKNPVFTLSTLVAIFAFLTQSLCYVTFPFFFTRMLGKDILEMGMLIAPWPLTAAVLAPIVGKLADKYSPAFLGGMGLLFLCIGLCTIVNLDYGVASYFIIGAMMLNGTGFALFIAPNQKALILSAPVERTGAASGVLGASRLIGQATGATIVAFCFNYFQDNTETVALYIGASSALIGALLSWQRLLYKK